MRPTTDASAWIRLELLTIPTSLPSLTTGTRLIRLRSNSVAISESGVSSDTETAPEVMISPTFLPCDLAKSAASVLAPLTASCHHGRCFSVPISTRWIRSASLSMPTRLPAASRTGRALTSCSDKSLTASATSVSGRTVTTSRIMTSIARMSPASEYIEEQDIEAGRQHHRHRQGQYPRHYDVAERR